jgi:hypothetical protein
MGIIKWHQLTAVDVVIAAATGQGVIARSAEQNVITRSAEERVIAGKALNVVIAVSPGDNIRAIRAEVEGAGVLAPRQCLVPSQ